MWRRQSEPGFEVSTTLQVIPARNGTATFVPAGKTIKIINSAGTQVVDLWAFALPKPETKDSATTSGGNGDKEAKPQKVEAQPTAPPQKTPAPGSKKKKGNNDLPSQEEAEQATREGLAQAGEAEATAEQKRSGWSSYVPTSYVPSVPSLGFGQKKGGEAKANQAETEKNSNTWGSYFTAGKGFSSYIPKQATDTVTQFAGFHERDKSKSYLQQLQDFSKTPVGAVGMAAATGSGYTSSLYAGYSAWNAANAAHAPAMEFLSLTHTRSSTSHLLPQVNDMFLTNLRDPVLTLIEDTTTAKRHDTLIPACDPMRYRDLGVENWESHGSCAENLVLALKELNERAGLKGAKAIGAEVTVNSVPAPLNLFMDVRWDNDGTMRLERADGKPGEFVRLKAERDVVVVMSSCPQDVEGANVNGAEPADAKFVVEEEESSAAAIRRTQPKKKPAPVARKASSAATSGGALAPVKKKPTPMPASQPSEQAAAPAKKTSQPVAKKPVRKPAQSTATPAPAPRKKPIPPSRRVSEQANSDATATPPVERKKPRKLVRQTNAADG
ncbi:unnamed protein product [Zymoseptoria tritici ST99CH_1A5]|uniref:DUF1989 domain-containing protein n=2 Tax=Zymoseptoria tritici TaxID=1047171 RepID=A0A2H1G4Z4_ZYMTR|nr:unnamed protein product [Zymoseptoria tritici ST99CH_1E4]SMY22502.1 unnamed protein product [Zymoseptoria tritici ST99CH_1A5]